MDFCILAVYRYQKIYPLGIDLDQRLPVMRGEGGEFDAHLYLLSTTSGSPSLNQAVLEATRIRSRDHARARLSGRKFCIG
jgi:hypothetical protein